MNKPKQPCPKYCPSRSAECKKTCERWLEYEPLRNAFYKWRLKEMHKTQVLNDMDNDRGRAMATGEFSRRKRKK